MRPKELEKYMFDRVNNERIKFHLPKLVYDDALSEVGYLHSVEQMENNEISHWSKITGEVGDRLQKFPFSTCGENVAVGPSIDISHQGLMDSHGHRANILKPAFRQIGIGISYNGKSYFTTQVFAKLFVAKKPNELEDKFYSKLNDYRLSKGLSHVALIQSKELKKSAVQVANKLEMKSSDVDLSKNLESISKELIANHIGYNELSIECAVSPDEKKIWDKSVSNWNQELLVGVGISIVTIKQGYVALYIYTKLNK